MDQQPHLPNMPAPDTAGGVELSDNALKQIKNEVVSLLSHNPDARNAMISAFLEALATAGVLTVGNFQAQVRGPMDSYFRDRDYEAATEAERHESPAVGQAEIAGH